MNKSKLFSAILLAMATTGIQANSESSFQDGPSQLNEGNLNLIAKEQIKINKIISPIILNMTVNGHPDTIKNISKNRPISSTDIIKIRYKGNAKIEAVLPIVQQEEERFDTLTIDAFNNKVLIDSNNNNEIALADSSVSFKLQSGVEPLLEEIGQVILPKLKENSNNKKVDAKEQTLPVPVPVASSANTHNDNSTTSSEMNKEDGNEEEGEEERFDTLTIDEFNNKAFIDSSNNTEIALTDSSVSFKLQSGVEPLLEEIGQVILPKLKESLNNKKVDAKEPTLPVPVASSANTHNDNSTTSSEMNKEDGNEEEGEEERFDTLTIDEFNNKAFIDSSNNTEIALTDSSVSFKLQSGVEPLLEEIGQVTLPESKESSNNKKVDAKEPTLPVPVPVASSANTHNDNSTTSSEMNKEDGNEEEGEEERFDTLTIDEFNNKAFIDSSNNTEIALTDSSVSFKLQSGIEPLLEEIGQVTLPESKEDSNSVDKNNQMILTVNPDKGIQLNNSEITGDLHNTTPINTSNNIAVNVTDLSSSHKVTNNADITSLTDSVLKNSVGINVMSNKGDFKHSGNIKGFENGIILTNIKKAEINISEQQIGATENAIDLNKVTYAIIEKGALNATVGIHVNSVNRLVNSAVITAAEVGIISVSQFENKSSIENQGNIKAPTGIHVFNSSVVNSGNITADNNGIIIHSKKLAEPKTRRARSLRLDSVINNDLINSGNIIGSNKANSVGLSLSSASGQDILEHNKGTIEGFDVAIKTENVKSVKASDTLNAKVAAALHGNNVSFIADNLHVQGDINYHDANGSMILKNRNHMTSNVQNVAHIIVESGQTKFADSNVTMTAHRTTANDLKPAAGELVLSGATYIDIPLTVLHDEAKNQQNYTMSYKLADHSVINGKGAYIYDGIYTGTIQALSVEGQDGSIRYQVQEQTFVTDLNEFTVYTGHVGSINSALIKIANIEGWRAVTVQDENGIGIRFTKLRDDSLPQALHNQINKFPNFAFQSLNIVKSLVNYLNNDELLINSQQKDGLKVHAMIKGESAKYDYSYFDSVQRSFFNGLAVTFNDIFLFGLGGGQTSGDSHDQNENSTKFKSDDFGLFGSLKFNNFVASALWATQKIKNDQTRHIDEQRLDGRYINEQSYANYKTNADTFGIKLSYLYQKDNNLMLRPFVSLTHIDANVDNYEETGSGDFNMSVIAHDYHYLIGAVGLDLGYSLNDKIMLTGSATYHHHFKKNDYNQEISFQFADSVLYSSDAQINDRDYYSFKAGVQYNVTEQIILNTALKYDSDFDCFKNYSVNAGIEVKF